MPVACEPLACEAVRWRSSVGWEGGGRIRVCGAGTRGAVRLGASLGAAAAPMRPVPDVDEEEGAAAAPAVERGLGRPDGEEGGGGERLCERERRSERAADAEQERVAQEAKGAHRVDEAVVHKDERVDGLQRACSQPGRSRDAARAGRARLFLEAARRAASTAACGAWRACSREMGVDGGVSARAAAACGAAGASRCRE